MASSGGDYVELQAASAPGLGSTSAVSHATSHPDALPLRRGMLQPVWPMALHVDMLDYQMCMHLLNYI